MPSQLETEGKGKISNTDSVFSQNFDTLFSELRCSLSFSPKPGGSLGKSVSPPLF